MTIIRKSKIKKNDFENTTEGNRNYIQALYQEYLVNATVDNVHRSLVVGKRSKININDSMKNLANARTSNNTVLSRSETSFIIGTVLGDSSLQYSSPLNTNPRLSCVHSARQSEWVFWKSEILWQILSRQDNRPATTSYQSPENSYQNSAIPTYVGETFCRIRVQSPVSPCLKTIRNLMYVGSRKVISRDYLNYTDSMFLMVLWLDDGSLNSGYRGMFSLVIFSSYDLEIFCEWMLIAWGLNMKCSEAITNDRGITMYPRGVYFTDQDELKNFLRIVAPLIPVKTMIYKVCWSSQNNPEATQRWKTELKSLIRKEWHEVVDSYYNIVNTSLQDNLGDRTLVIESNYIQI